jgi:branched-chain amino acid transport system ATP-binding protein
MSSEREVLLQASGLQAWYGSSHVLQGVDFTLRRGEAMGLLGRNGMGKSTLIRTLMGHVTLRQGGVRLMAQDVSHARPHEMARPSGT